jgi:hypothetical protein
VNLGVREAGKGDFPYLIFHFSFFIGEIVPLKWQMETDK